MPWARARAHGPPMGWAPLRPPGPLRGPGPPGPAAPAHGGPMGPGPGPWHGSGNIYIYIYIYMNSFQSFFIWAGWGTKSRSFGCRQKHVFLCKTDFVHAKTIKYYIILIYFMLI